MKQLDYYTIFFAMVIGGVTAPLYSSWWKFAIAYLTASGVALVTTCAICLICGRK